MLSIVIPVYNEKNRLGQSLDKITAYFEKRSSAYEIIVVDDGSTDNTKEIVQQHPFFKQGRIKLLENGINRGKGFSVRQGIFAAEGERILFSDADLSTPIEEYEKLLQYLGSENDIVIGSRSISGAQVRVRQPFYREYMGKFFNILVRLLVMKGLVDTQCGFKLFKSAAIKDIASQLKIDGFAFDVEILYLAQKKKLRIKEVPVVWINSPASKVKPLSDSSRMFMELLRIKRIHR